MQLAAGSKRYLVDTCTLIRWSARLLGTNPKDAAFRQRVWAAFRRGQLNISTTIEEELMRHRPELAEALKQLGVVAIKVSPQIEGEAQAKAAELKSDGRITGDRCVGISDIEIIFTAKSKKMTVVTEEAQGRERCNMPTVCRELGVRCLSSAQLLAELGF